MADSCAALPDRNRFLQDTDMSTVPALALDHVLNLMMIKTMRMRHAEHVPNTWEIKKAYEILDEEPKGKLPFVRTRCRRTKDTKMHNKEIRWKRADWIRLAENRVQWCSGEPTIIKFWVLYEAGSIWLSITFLSVTHDNQPPHPMSSYSWSNRLSKNGPYHATMDVGSCSLFTIMAHTSMQCFIYTSHTDSFSIYVGYVTMLSASHATVVPTEVLTLHAIQWLRNVMKPCHSE